MLFRTVGHAKDWLQSLRQFSSIVLYFTLQVYDMTDWWKIVLRTGASLVMPVCYLSVYTYWLYARDCQECVEPELEHDAKKNRCYQFCFSFNYLLKITRKHIGQSVRESRYFMPVSSIVKTIVDDLMHYCIRPSSVERNGESGRPRYRGIISKQAWNNCFITLPVWWHTYKHSLNGVAINDFIKCSAHSNHAN